MFPLVVCPALPAFASAAASPALERDEAPAPTKEGPPCLRQEICFHPQNRSIYPTTKGGLP